MILLRLTESWVGREDKGLWDRLAAELPSILVWALDGLDRLRRRGDFVQPKTALDDLEVIGDLSSTIGAFVRDRCVVGSDYAVAKKDLYEAYRGWCDARGIGPQNDIVFGRDLKSVVPKLSAGRGPREDINGCMERRTQHRGIGLVAGVPDAGAAENWARQL
jgi:putative DNA primase/helicase